MYKISVVVTTFNRPDYLKDSLFSVLNQIPGDFELDVVLVDDGSRIDYSSGILNELNDSRITLHRIENSGLSAARNYGVKFSKGDWICFLDDDDLWEQNKINKQIEASKLNPDAYLIHGKCQIIDAGGAKIDKYIGANRDKVHLRSGNVFWNAIGTWVVKAPTPLIKREVFNKVLFDESIKVGEDIDFYWRVFYFFKVHYLDEVLAFYREYESTQSERLSKKKLSYVGVEYKFYLNLTKSTHLNFSSRYKILQKLINSAKKRAIELNIPSPNKLKIIRFISPLYCLKYFSRIN
jgi:glycosyltransferase involved in cell wall biosynthesis